MDKGDPPVDREAVFLALFDAYYGKVLAYATRRLGPSAAEEAVADTFIAAWSSLDDVPADPLLWLYGIARGAVANHRRRMLRAARLDERARVLSSSAPSDDPADVVVWEDTFVAALAQLGDSDREVLRLVAWEGLTAAEAAAVIGCSTIACKVRLHRARQRLRRFLRVDVGPTRRPAGSGPIDGSQAATAEATADAGADPRRGVHGPEVRSSTEPPSWPPVMPEGHPC
jgi:RNA polymerase sigma factor (sigma-70 family)